MTEQKEIPVVDIFFWLALILLIVLLTWRAFGSSPTTEAVAFAVTFFGTILAWKGLKKSARTENTLNEIKSGLSVLSEHTEILKDIRNILKTK